MKAEVQFDGGCSPNPGQKYGSYAITIDDSFQIQERRFELGRGTSNEAEFDSLLRALNQLQIEARKCGVQPNEVEVHIITDSTIVRNWLQRFERFNPAKCKGERRLAMGALAGQCIAALKPFHSFSIEWKGRDNNVALFGH